MNSPLPRRSPGAELAAIVPPQLPPLDVNWFEVPAGESVERRFDAGRLHLIGRPTDTEEPTP